MESSINSILSVKCPDSIIKPPEDTTYLMRDYEDEFTGQYYEHGDRVKSEEAFCGHTSLRSGHSIRLFDKPVRLNSHPWVSRYYYSCLVVLYLSSFGLLATVQFLQQMLFYARQLLFFCSSFHQNSLSQLLFSLLHISNLLPNPIQSIKLFQC